MTRGRTTNPFSRLWLSTIILVSVSTLTGCEGAAPAGQALPHVPPKPLASSSPPATSGQQEEPYVASGPIVVENQVDVSAQREGVVTQILADVGELVHRGQLLARLDDRQLTAQRDAIEAKLHSSEANLKDWESETKVAEADFKRAELMREAGINTQEALDHAHYTYLGSQFEIDKARQDMKNAQSTLRDFELELQKTRIEAPFDGVVARRYVRAGERISSGERLFWVSAVAPLLVKFTLPERLMGKIKKGDRVYVSSLAAPQTEHAAKLIQISPVVDPASDSIDVVAKLEGKPLGLRPGMTASVRLASVSPKPR
jgi:RND family efflux transporter MFP subunit